jgi:DNA helicase-2/ATP-dependent DNA helicase PcrA
VPKAVDAITVELGYDPEATPHADEEVTRQSDLGRLRSLAVEFERAHPDGDAVAFSAELAERFSTEHSGRGVNLLTYHRAKGLEFDAVFLPRLVDGEIPFRSGRSRADEAEERRLFYVALTRARRRLALSWPTDGKSGRSPFIEEIGGPPEPAPAAASKRAASTPVATARDGPLLERLRRWRLERSRADGVPAYVVFHDATLAHIADRKPQSRLELLDVPGIGPAKLDRYGDEVLDVVGAAG